MRPPMIVARKLPMALTSPDVLADGPGPARIATMKAQRTAVVSSRDPRTQGCRRPI